MPEKPVFRGFRSPNYTQVPDELFDELLASLSGAELKVLLYIVRRTFGFKKVSDDISLSQITGGIVTNAGKRIDSGTGLAKSTAAVALKGLVQKHIIVKARNQETRRGDMATTYALNLIAADVQESGPPVSGNRTPPVSETGHPGGRKSDTQYTVTKIQKVVNDVTANDPVNSRIDRTSAPGTVPTISEPALRRTYQLTDQQIGRVHWLVQKQIDLLGAGQRNHAHYVKRAAEAIRDDREDLLERTLGDFKQAATTVPVGNRPGYFHAMYADALGQPHDRSADTTSTDADPRVARLIADAERRGFPVPTYIREADILTANRWWAELGDSPAP